MARKLPKPLHRRELLYGISTPAGTQSELGDAYLEQELHFDAVDFYARAQDRAGLKKIVGISIREGDAFLLRKVQEAMPEFVSAGDWRALAARARELGKEIYAERADGGGTPPPPPLHEEEKIDEGATDGDAAPPGADDAAPGPEEA
jgi:hypothetical protein